MRYPRWPAMSNTYYMPDVDPLVQCRMPWQIQLISRFFQTSQLVPPVQERKRHWETRLRPSLIRTHQYKKPPYHTYHPPPFIKLHKHRYFDSFESIQYNNAPTSTRPSMQPRSWTRTSWTWSWSHERYDGLRRAAAWIITRRVLRESEEKVEWEGKPCLFLAVSPPRSCAGQIVWKMGTRVYAISDLSTATNDHKFRPNDDQLRLGPSENKTNNKWPLLSTYVSAFLQLQRGRRSNRYRRLFESIGLYHYDSLPSGCPQRLQLSQKWQSCIEMQTNLWNQTVPR